MKIYIVLKPIYLFFPLCFLSLSSGCRKENLPDQAKTVAEAYQMIVGEWEWERTVIQGRGQETPIYETPDTENKTIHETFMENLKSSRVETKDEVSTRTDHEYNIMVNSSGNIGAFLLKSIDVNTGDTRQLWFRFKDKRTLVFYHGSSPFTSYYTRK